VVAAGDQNGHCSLSFNRNVCDEISPVPDPILELNGVPRLSKAQKTNQ
jgi:hypothetical protein